MASLAKSIRNSVSRYTGCTFVIKKNKLRLWKHLAYQNLRFHPPRFQSCNTKAITAQRYAYYWDKLRLPEIPVFMINLILAVVPRQFDARICGFFIIMAFYHNTAMMVTCKKTKSDRNLIPYPKKCPKWIIDCNLETKIK